MPRASAVSTFPWQNLSTLLSLSKERIGVRVFDVSITHRIVQHRSAAEHAFDLAAGEADMHRTSVRAVGFKRGAVEIGQQGLDFGIL
jgi:hypothetical protein